MDLQRQFFPRIKNFTEEWKMAFIGGLVAAENFRRMVLHQPAQGLASQLAVHNDAGVAGPVTDFPRFADGFAGRQFLAIKLFDFASAPNAFLENRMENKRIEHWKSGGGLGNDTVFTRLNLLVEMAVGAEFVVASLQPLGHRQRENFLEMLEQMRF
jgi:hypothetical protein